MLFRYHRGGLAESMSTVCEVATWSDIIDKLDCYDIDIKSLKCEFYSHDDRIDWDVHCICDKNGLKAWTNGMMESAN